MMSDNLNMRETDRKNSPFGEALAFGSYRQQAPSQRTQLQREGEVSVTSKMDKELQPRSSLAPKFIDNREVLWR